ncbi:MAG: ribonucleoside triphosphate reductase [Acidaminobacteraceae bacterium]
MIKLIEKRNHELVVFKRDKIDNAVFKALLVSKKSRSQKNLKKLSELIVDSVVDNLNVIGKETFKVEEIQDNVELVLMQMAEYETAKNYIKYRYEHKKKREKKETVDDIMNMFNEYIGQTDWTVKENSNMSYSLQGLNNHVIAKATKTFWLNSVYDESIRRGHENGDIHIHDLGLLSTYCCGWSLEDILTRGFGGVAGKVESAPAKHFETALMQIVNFIYTLQGEAAGAQALSNFDTLLAPFIRSDELSYGEVKQAMQSFVFNMNIATRVGFQTPFFNITMDKEVPSTHSKLPVIIGGERDYTSSYADYQKEMNMINIAFCEVMMEGDSKGRVFTFPIPTYNITKNWKWDEEVTDKIMEMTAKFGIPYFSNFVNSDLDPEDVRSMCCRLRLDNKELIRRGGGLFGANPKTGSIGVVTINMARMGYVSADRETLFDKIEKNMIIAKNSLELKRVILEENMHKGLYPYSKYYLQDVYESTSEYWNNHFATIGPNGINECIINFTNGDEDITTTSGKRFAEEILDFMNDVLIKFQNDTGHLYNLEASPAEGTAYRFANLDKEMYPDIVQAGDEYPYYTNSSQLPVGYTDDLFEALDLQDELQIKYTGGTVLHGFVSEKIESIATVKKILQKVTQNYKLPYFTITPTFSICPEHKYISGEEFSCPICGKDTEVWSRVVGYHRPVSNWNDGKKGEYKDRLEFSSN